MELANSRAKNHHIGEIALPRANITNLLFDPICSDDSSGNASASSNLEYLHR